VKIRSGKESGPVNPLMPGAGSGRTDEKIDEVQAISQEAVNVDLSESSRGVKRARALLASIADLRIDKVTQLRSAIEDGSYQVQSDKIARRMVDEALRESARLRQDRGV
jgi:flagellar biosynthesis anti-sigma factor FlgM